MLLFKKCKRCNKIKSITGINEFGFCLDCQKKIKEIAQTEKLKSNVEFEKRLNSLKIVELVLNNNADFHRQKMLDMPDIHYKEISSSKNNLSNFVVIDTETTGIKVSGNRIIEISAIKYVNLKPVCCFTTLINPKINIPDEATQINNITNDMVADKPYFYQVKDCFFNFIGNSPIIGHNVSFDLRHIFASGLDLVSNRQIFDTMRLAKNDLSFYCVSNYKLSTLCDYCNIGFTGAHRSLADCYATGELFVKLLDNAKN